MGPGHGDAVLQAHQLGQHFSPGYYRDRVLKGRHYFGVVLVDRRRNHHHIRTGDLPGGMAFIDTSAKGLEPVGDIRGPQIGTGDFVSQIEQ